MSVFIFNSDGILGAANKSRVAFGRHFHTAILQRSAQQRGKNKLDTFSIAITEGPIFYTVKVMLDTSWATVILSAYSLARGVSDGISKDSIQIEVRVVEVSFAKVQRFQIF
jgi:hypothetical protein